MEINIDLVEDLEVDGVIIWDYPDFCDAYFCRAIWTETGLELTEDELIQLGNDYPELLNTMAYESLI